MSPDTRRLVAGSLVAYVVVFWLVVLLQVQWGGPRPSADRSLAIVLACVAVALLTAAAVWPWRRR